MRFFEPATGNPDAFFEPNSFNGPVEDHRFDQPLLKLSGDAARYSHREGNCAQAITRVPKAEVRGFVERDDRAGVSRPA